ncbi:hypothetical protein LPN01_00765 [Sphingomonas sp. A2-49]|uniref:hypothetical protein n=1 Tax=Sphingomonas sp. A2-49 TaxID=1391375 RepID=UPI0021D0F1BF|nr:hypothetical protein [Sphingomonas sp. A2-49]MCU6452604.1 hypothetical protein [Sphingomonas sp. A2-49]
MRDHTRSPGGAVVSDPPPSARSTPLPAYPSSMNVIAQIDSAAPLAQHSMPNPHWHKVG